VRDRQFLAGLVGALLVALGLMALWWPVYIDQYDQYGVQISCGSGFSAGISADALTGPDGHHVVERCGTALLLRRVWAIPAALLGWLLVTGFLIAWLHHQPKPEDAPSRP
jgi:hypothetical protein